MTTFSLTVRDGAVSWDKAAFVANDYNESWCLSCWEQAQEPSADWLERQMAESMSPSEEARYYQRMKGGQTGW